MAFTPTYIYFDLDDTLLDHKQAERRGLYDIHDHFDLFNPVSADELVEVYHRVNSRQWLLYSRGEVNRQQLQRNRFELTLRELGVDSDAYAKVGQQYMQYYRNHWQWIPGAEKAFEQVRDRYDTGVLTNGFAETQKLKFEAFSLYDRAHHLVISEEVGALKPHPSVFEHATELAGCPPEEILYVGDSFTSDVQGGTDYGWKVAWYTQNGATEQHAKADFVFNEFDELKSLLEV